MKIVGRMVTSGATATSDKSGTLASLGNCRPDGPVEGEDLSFPPANEVAAAALLEQRRQNFMQSVLTIVKRHAPDFDPATLEVRISRKNTYLSLTCTILATSREQLDGLYRELCDQPNVVMVL